MNICVLTHLFPARSETFVYQHVLGLKKRGHKVTVIARNIGEAVNQSELDELDRLGVQRIYVGSYQSGVNEIVGALRAIFRAPKLYSLLRAPDPWSRGELVLALDMVKYIRRVQPDLLHVHFGVLAARLERIRRFVQPLPPILVTWHGYDANAIPRSLGSDVYSALFATDNLHTVGSSFMRQRLLTLGAKDDRVVINPMGIDLDRFTFSDRTPSHDGTPLNVLSVGRLDEMKGHRFLIEAIGHLRQRGVSVRLRIVGEGPLRSELEHQTVIGGLTESVHLLGALPSEDVAAEMRCADLFALGCVESSSGKVEAQGVVFAEAQAMGLPVISCDVGGVAESMINGETGLLCGPGDALALADAIEYFAQNRPEIQSFGGRGRSFVEENFSVEAMLGNFEKAYEQMM